MMKFNYPWIKLLFILIPVLVINTSLIPAKTSWASGSTERGIGLVSKNGHRTEGALMMYDSLHLDSLALSREAFNDAMHGLDSLETAGLVQNDSILSIVDFSLPSFKKRLFVINLSSGKLLFNTLVSHGKNSGKELATRFSNNPNSFESSLGFYVTGNTYKGEHGYSLRLEGLEKGINDNALSRGIVMHSAQYVNEDIIKTKGCIGRSLGCPAVPRELHKAIIETIKDGTCLFMYSPSKKYASRSKMLPQQQSVDLG